jgi:thiol-disulfide isomerase/thioredoxin
MSGSEIIELSESEWEKNVEKGDKPVFVMFYGPTCPYCNQMEPYFNEYAKEFKKKILFARVNVTNNPTIISRYGIMGTPTFKYFCKGHPIKEISGAIYPSLLKKTIQEGLNHGEKCQQKTTWFDPSYA